MTLVEVTSLDWRDGVGTSIKATVPFGYYCIEDVGDNWTTDRYWMQFGRVLSKHASLAEAKAAAQADYETRILSALVAPSQPAAVGVTDEMVEFALDAFLGVLSIPFVPGAPRPQKAIRAALEAALVDRDRVK